MRYTLVYHHNIKLANLLLEIPIYKKIEIVAETEIISSFIVYYICTFSLRCFLYHYLSIARILMTNEPVLTCEMQLQNVTF